MMLMGRLKEHDDEFRICVRSRARYVAIDAFRLYLVLRVNRIEQLVFTASSMIT